MSVKWKDEYGFGRPMSVNEVILHDLHQKDMWVLVRTLMVSCAEKPQMHQVDDALRYMMKWNPSLRMAIKKQKDGSHAFQEQAEAKPRLYCQFNEANWKQVMENELLVPIGDCEAPQFRCTYLPNVDYPTDGDQQVCAFVFVFNHAIIDGMSTMSSLRGFTRILNDIVATREPNVQPWQKMYPPSDFYCLRELEVLPEERRKEIQSTPQLDPKEFFHPKECLYTDRRELEAIKDPSLPLKTSLIIKDWTEEEVNRLRTTCRANGTTIQAAAQIAGSIALAKILQNSDDWETLEVEYSLAANLRPHIAKEVPVDYTGLYIAVLFGFKTSVEKEVNDIKTAKAAFWKMAKESSSLIKHQLENRIFLHVSMAMAGMNVKEWINLDVKGDKRENRMADLLFTTSYGAWKFPLEHGDSINPLQVYSISSIHHAGPIFSQQLITVNGKMSWVIGYSPRVVSEKAAQQFTDSMFSLLETAVQQDK